MRQLTSRRRQCYPSCRGDTEADVCVAEDAAERDVGVPLPAPGAGDDADVRDAAPAVPPLPLPAADLGDNVAPPSSSSTRISRCWLAIICGPRGVTTQVSHRCVQVGVQCRGAEGAAS